MKKFIPLFGLLAAAVLVIYFWFFPVSQYYFDDEWFFLPERIWFKSRADWLGHLLFFNQTRFTWVGDYMLCRPGLFFWSWLQDIWFRGDRWGQQLCLVAVTVSIFAVLFNMIRKECGVLLALAFTVYAFACGPGGFAYAWPHINGYFVAIGFYTLACWFYFRENFRTAGVFFLIAAFFHEFVPLTLLVLTAIELFRRAPRRRISAVAIPVSIYAVMALAGYLIFRPPGLVSPGEMNGVEFDSNRLQNMLTVFKFVFLQIGDVLAPFPFNDEIILWIRLGFAAAVILLAGFVFWKRPRGEKLKIAYCLIPLAVLLVGLGFGRVATRLVVKAHYYPMFQYFLIMGLGLTFGSILKRRSWLMWTVIAVLMASSVRTAFAIHEMNWARSPLVPLTDKVVGEIQSKLEDGCFAGLFDQEFRYQLNTAVNIALQESRCGWKSGRPVFYSLAADETLTDFSPPPFPWSAMKNVTKDLGPALPSGELAPYLMSLPSNFRETGKDGGIMLRGLSVVVQGTEIVAAFVSAEPFPQLNNVGLRVKSPDETKYYLLINNVLRVIRLSADGKYTVLNESQLAEVKPDLSVRLSQTKNGCLIFVDDQLITQMESCLSGTAEVGVFSFANGTPEERLVSLSFL